MGSIKGSKRLFWIIAIPTAILIGIPIFVFLIYFHDHRISIELKDWADFGGYFGGIIQPIISLLSLIVLAYITYLVSKDSNKQAFRLNIMQRKLDAYEEFIKHFLLFNRYSQRFVHITNVIEKKVFNLSSLGDWKSTDLQELLSLTTSFQDYFSFISNFGPRFNHIFNNELDRNLSDNVSNSAELVSTSSYQLFNEYQEYAIAAGLIASSLPNRSELKNAIDEHLNQINAFKNHILSQITLNKEDLQED